jgi:uncharacterized protein YndB with AHSA1/START domain
MATVSVQREFTKPIDRVFAYLAEHEHLEALFGAKVRRLRDGDDGHRNGVGSKRELKIGPLPSFDETVTDFTPNELIRYRITRGSPLRDHEGTMRFAPTPNGGSRLDYVITFGAVVPGLDAVIARGLDRNIRKGLEKVETEA